MNFHRTFVVFICVIWQLLNGGHGLREIETKTYSNELGSTPDCVTDFKFEEFDSDEEDMIFSWRGPKGYHNGINYMISCARFKSFYYSYKPFNCSGSQSSSLSKQTGKSSYFTLFNTTFYCTVKTSIVQSRRSNIVTVKTPGKSKRKGMSVKTQVIVGVSVFCVVFFFSVIFGICFCRKRKIPVTGVVERKSAPPYPITAQPQPCMQENPLGNPLPHVAIYTVMVTEIRHLRI